MISILNVSNKVKRRRFVLLQNIRFIWPILLVVVLVLITTWLTQRHLVKLQDSATSSYENKIITQHYLYELTNLFNVKRLRLSTDSRFSDGFIENARIEELLTNYSEIKLVVKELFLLNHLIKNYAELTTLEKSSVGISTNKSENLNNKMNTALNKLMLSMDNLENAILIDRPLLAETTKKSIDMNKFLLNIEIAFLIIMGIIIQVVLFYPQHEKTI